MADSNSKVVLAVGLTALVVTVLLIAGFAGYLYFRQTTVPTRGDNPGGPGQDQTNPRTRRERGSIAFVADDILTVSYVESSMGNRPAPSPAAFSKIDMNNYGSSSSSVTFASDGTAMKITSSESTVNGTKQPSKNERYTGSIERSLFADLAEVLADNDFANEPDSRDITSLPINKVLTIAYNGGEKKIVTAHTGKNSVETAEMITAIKDLEKKVSWRLVK